MSYKSYVTYLTGVASSCSIKIPSQDFFELNPTFFSKKNAVFV